MNVGIFTIATGKYIQFIDQLYTSIKDNFLIQNNKLFIIFSDCEYEKIEELKNQLNIEILFFKIEKKGFPGDTLYRYHYFNSIQDELKKYNLDVVYYFDADMKVVSNIGDEVLPTQTKKLILTAHPGFFNKPGNQYLGTPETNPKSTAFIPKERFRHCYFAGGFNGGTYSAFMEMSSKIKNNIDIDNSNNIIAVWHDESHLNEYVSNIQDKIKILTPSYCYPENRDLPYHKKIIALDKNHREIRS